MNTSLWLFLGIIGFWVAITQAPDRRWIAVVLLLLWWVFFQIQSNQRSWDDVIDRAFFPGLAVLTTL